jgi:hypothetical protein
MPLLMVGRPTPLSDLLIGVGYQAAFRARNATAGFGRISRGGVTLAAVRNLGRYYCPYSI